MTQEITGIMVLEIPTLKTWHTPATDYPNSKVGKAEVNTVRYNGVYEAYGLHGIQYYRASKLSIRALKIGRKVWMVDDPPHWWAMEDHAQFFRGHVLVAGLGLGLIVHTLTANPDVERITVIEREQDVIDLISPHIPQDKLTIEYGDFWDWSEATADVDGVFFDLFVGDGRELISEALRTYIYLTERFPRPVRIHGFNNCCLDKLAIEVERSKKKFERLARSRRVCLKSI